MCECFIVISLLYNIKNYRNYLYCNDDYSLEAAALFHEMLHLTVGLIQNVIVTELSRSLYHTSENQL